MESVCVRPCAGSRSVRREARHETGAASDARGPAIRRERVVARGGIAMRDPELVFKAQLAASALERAWQHWRVIHGLLADPMPATSSYVGYSLEEPWGQPRVVFALAATHAQQLAALLERPDRLHPVHSLTAHHLRPT